MTQYIVDASVVAEYIVNSTYTANAQALLRGALTGDQFTVPEICLPECTNVIWKMVRFHGMTAPQASQALRDLQALPLRRAATKSLLGNALAIGLNHSLAIYDSLYIALAIKTGGEFVTLDTRQERASIAEGVVTHPITYFKP